jgi:hypothetical protein
MKSAMLFCCWLACVGCVEAPSELGKLEAASKKQVPPAPLPGLPAPLPDGDERHAIITLRFGEKGVELVTTALGSGPAPASRRDGPISFTMLGRDDEKLGRKYLDDPRDVRAYDPDSKTGSVDPVVRMNDVEVPLAFPLAPGLDRLRVEDAAGKLQASLVIGEALAEACSVDGTDPCQHFLKYR